MHDVVGAAREQPAAQLLVDHVVRRRHDVGQAHAVGGVVERVERPYLHALWYSPGHPGRVARIPGRTRRAERVATAVYSPEWPVARSCASSRRARSWMRPSRCRARSGARVETDAHSSISSSPTRAGACVPACGTASGARATLRRRRHGARARPRGRVRRPRRARGARRRARRAGRSGRVRARRAARHRRPRRLRRLPRARDLPRRPARPLRGGARRARLSRALPHRAGDRERPPLLRGRPGRAHGGRRARSAARLRNCTRGWTPTCSRPPRCCTTAAASMPS